MKVSIYVKDLYYSPSSYYRLIQYFKNDSTIIWHAQLTEKEYKKWMPITKQNIFIKGLLLILLYFRLLSQLLSDRKAKVDVVIVSRRFIQRIFPISYKIILCSIIKKGGRIVWDFDDHIIESKEIKMKDFCWLADKSEKIVVTHEFLQNLIPERYINKVVILPTTDGDIYHLYSEEISKKKALQIEKEIRFTWVGTAGNLKYVEPLIPIMDRFAKECGKKIILTIVSDSPLNIETESLLLINKKWAREAAAEEIVNSHIGLMPLVDSIFAKGKGGFKLVQYLSAGVPIIASNVGYNEAVCNKENGCLLDNIYDYEQFKTAALNLTETEQKWLNYSFSSIDFWRKNFSYENNKKVWDDIIKKRK